MMNKKNLNLKNDKRAVSPVIGVILMVAITVILAAVIGAFVFGMGSHVKMTYTVAATAHHTLPGGIDTVSVTYMGGPDADFVDSVNVSINDAHITGTGGAGETWSPAVVGSSVNTSVGVTDGRTNHVIAVARFEDDAEQVILDTYV